MEENNKDMLVGTGIETVSEEPETGPKDEQELLAELEPEIEPESVTEAYLEGESAAEDKNAEAENSKESDFAEDAEAEDGGEKKKTKHKKKDKHKEDKEEDKKEGKKKKLCKLVKADYLKKHLEEYKLLTLEPDYICAKCGRTAKDKKSLHKPVEL